MKYILALFTIAFFCEVKAQELYPYAEPASNMPSHSLSLKNTTVVQKDIHADRTLQRYMPEVMFGINKNWMVHVSTSFSNMHQPSLIWEGARGYAKYRFLSADEVHKHFRMAVFGGATYSRNHLDHNEINLAMLDQSGVQAGLIATQLWNKFAISATGSWNEVLNKERWDKVNVGRYAYQSLNYSLSTGLLVLPFNYKNYDQANVNIYAELIGSRNMDYAEARYFVDLAPSIQAIFKSTAKLSIGYRFQLASDIYRLSKNSWMISFEYIFLNALKK